MKTILIVEDDIEIAEGLRSILEDEGYRIVTAFNGRDGLQAISTDRPDLVLLDLMMPIMDGYQVLQEVDADKDLRQIPIIIMTAGDGGTASTRAGRPVLRKPFDLELLLRTIRQKLGPSAG